MGKLALRNRGRFYLTAAVLCLPSKEKAIERKENRMVKFSDIYIKILRTYYSIILILYRHHRMNPESNLLFRLFRSIDRTSKRERNRVWRDYERGRTSFFFPPLPPGFSMMGARSRVVESSNYLGRSARKEWSGFDRSFLFNSVSRYSFLSLFFTSLPLPLLLVFRRGSIGFEEFLRFYRILNSSWWI